jgi:hypothetical protein
MKTIVVEITGTMPLLMHSQGGMNLKDDLARQYSILSKKRSKTDEEKANLSEMEFRLGLYWDRAAQCAYMPSFNIIRCIQDGGKKLKLGKKVIESLRCSPECVKVPLLYPGREAIGSIDGLVARPEFWDVRTVTVGASTVERTRPRFDVWSLHPVFLLDDENMGVEEVQACLDKAGFYVGLGDFRVGTDRGGQFGTFTASVSVRN